MSGKNRHSRNAADEPQAIGGRRIKQWLGKGRISDLEAGNAESQADEFRRFLAETDLSGSSFQKYLVKTQD